MSVPIVAATLADAIAPVLREIAISIGHKTAIERSVMVEHGREVEYFSAYIHAHQRRFHGNADTPSRALMIANSALQTFVETIAKDLAK